MTKREGDAQQGGQRWEQGQEPIGEGGGTDKGGGAMGVRVEAVKIEGEVREQERVHEPGAGGGEGQRGRGGSADRGVE